MNTREVFKGRLFWSMALIVLGLVAVWAWPSAERTLNPLDPVSITRNNYVLVDIPQTSGAAFVWTISEQTIEPFSGDPVSIRFWVSSTETTDVRFTLGGRMATQAECYSEAYDVSHSPYALLNERAQSLAKYYQMIHPYQGQLTLPAHARWARRDLAVAQRNAMETPYYVVTPEAFTGEKRSIKSTQAKMGGETYDFQVASFVCAFPADVFWHQDGDRATFVAPGVLAGATFRAEPNYLFVNAQYSFSRSPEAPVDYASSPASYTDPDVMLLDEFSSSWDSTTSVGTSLSGPVASFVPLNASADKEMRLLAVGFALALASAFAIILVEGPPRLGLWQWLQRKVTGD